MFATTQMAGQNLAVPDVCLTPPAGAPVPYPNIAVPMMGVGAPANILMSGAPAHNMATTIPLTNGDNAGVMLGAASGMVMGQSKCTTGAFTVLLKGMPATRMSSTTLQNGTNAPGCTIAPSQTKVLILAG